MNKRTKSDKQTNKANNQPLRNATKHVQNHKSLDRKRRYPIRGCLYLINKKEIGTGFYIDFLEWLIQDKKLNPYDVGIMPHEKFIELAHEYAQRKRNHLLRDKLEKRFFVTGIDKLVKEYSDIEKYKSVSIKDAFERYCECNSHRYKCLILPLAETTSQMHYENLINYYWEDLNSLSGEHLDIYYSEADKNVTGFDTAKCIESLPEKVKISPPSIILWKGSPQYADAIPIRNLNEDQVFDVICTIVRAISADEGRTQIVEKAKNKAEELKDNSRTFTIDATEIARAMAYIDESNELIQKYKNEIKKALSRAASMSGKPKNEREEIQEKLRNAWKLIKKYAPKLLTRLAELATILSMFTSLQQ